MDVQVDLGLCYPNMPRDTFLHCMVQLYGWVKTDPVVPKEKSFKYEDGDQLMDGKMEVLTTAYFEPKAQVNKMHN